MAQKKYKKREFIRINAQIRYSEVRVLSEDGDNLGTMSSDEAMKKASEMGLDLIQLSGKSRPPIVKIADYGKFLYDKKKKEKASKAKQSVTETKTVQVKVGTSEGDLILKAKNISSWLKDGHRVKLDLFLRGRVKYLDKQFLKDRLLRILKLVTVAYRIADGPKKSPKGLTVFLEKGSKKDMGNFETKKTSTEQKTKVMKKNYENK